MKRCLLIIVALAGFSVAGANPADAQQEKVRKLVQVEHVDVQEIANLVGWIRFYVSRQLGTIVLEGLPDEIAKAEAIIREVDQPRSKQDLAEGRIEIDAYFLAGGSEATGGPTPELLEPVTAELRKRFTYAGYGLLDSALVQANVGKGARVTGQFSREEAEPVSYTLAINSTSARQAEGGRTIFLGGLRAEWNLPYKERVTNLEGGHENTQVYNREYELRIDSDVSIPEGKLVVVGKAGSPTTAQAIFLVLRARLMQ